MDMRSATTRSFASVAIAMAMGACVWGMACVQQSSPPRFSEPPKDSYDKATFDVSIGVVVVLGHDYWRRQFSGANEAIGKVMTINGSPATIIGVALGGFDIPDHAQLWVGRR